MRKFLITISIMLNDKKISAIKDLRGATGMGLSQSKEFCERQIPGIPGAFGGSLIVNGDQAARFLILATSDYQPFQPRFMVEAIEEIKDQAVDISNLLM